MSALPETHPEVEIREASRSGEHVIDLDRLVDRAFEQAFEADLQATSQITRFELEAVLASPEVRPTEPPPTPIVGKPIVNVVADEYDAITIGSLPPPAIEI